MRKERRMLISRMIRIEKQMDSCEQAADNGTMSDMEYNLTMSRLIPERSEAERDFLKTYSKEWGIPFYADNLGAYDQYQKDNAAGLCG